MKTLAEHMQDIGLTDAALATAVGCDRSTITKIRLRRITPSLPLALSIRKITNVAVEALLPAKETAE